MLHYNNESYPIKAAATAAGGGGRTGIIRGERTGAEYRTMVSVGGRTAKAALVERMQTAGIIAIMRHTAPALARQTVEALSAGGVQVIEVTMNSAGAADMLQELAAAYQDDMLLGAGTVLTVSSAEEALSAGGALHRRPEHGSARHRVLRPARRARGTRRVDADRGCDRLAAGRRSGEDFPGRRTWAALSPRPARAARRTFPSSQRAA